MKKRHLWIIGACVLIGAGMLFFAHSEPSSEVLDKDLAEIHAAIAAADTEAAQYRGGLILVQLQLRKSVLQTTEAMLLQKRKSLLRRINLKYSVDTKEVKPASADQLSAIEKDMQDVESKIKKALDEAAQYRGGLIQITLLMNAETQKMTLAALQHKYYTAKYGIPFVAVDFDKAHEKKAPVGKAVEDKDAL